MNYCCKIYMHTPPVRNRSLPLLCIWSVYVTSDWSDSILSVLYLVLILISFCDLTMSYVSGSQRVGSQTSIISTPGDLLEMQILARPQTY